MDVVEFVENVYNFKLLDYQKEFVRVAYDAAKNKKQLIYYPGRVNSKYVMVQLQALAVIKASQDLGLWKGDLFDMDTDEGLKRELEKEEKLKTCSRCVHDGESTDIAGSTCYLCKRNPEDHRIDWWEEKKDGE